MIQGLGQEITEIPAFGHDITEVRAMGQLVWQKSIPDYLCFTALEAGQFTLTIPAAVTPTYLSYVEWSKDGRTWTRLTVDDTAQSITTPIIPVGGKVYWRGSGSRMAYDYSVNKYSVFSSTGTFDVSGDLRSLLFSDDFENVATTNQRYCFTGLFYGASVVNASNLRLALTGNSAYMYCFRGCTQLLHAPALMEGNTIMQWQFHSTYDGCTNLVTGTDLQATSVGVRGCYYTYKSCTSLVKAPNISSITTIGNGGLSAMFHGCSSLTYIKCLATSLYDDGDASHFATSNWLAGVSSTGTFIQAEGVTWPRGASGIPTGWVDVEKRTMPSGYKQVEYLQAVKPYPSNYNAAIVGTGIVLDPSQDTIEFAVWPRLDEDGYLINGGGSTAGEMPFANSSSPTSTTAKVGFFYWLYRVNSSTNLLSAFFTRVNGDGTNHASGFSLDATNKVTDNPQTIRVEFSATSSVMYLNGTQVASRSGYTVDTSDMATMQAFVLAYNNKTYSWEHPFYYLKWWRGANLIADYVPCVRESDDEVGFYDFASQTFKTRYYTSSEPFTAGEEI